MPNFGHLNNEELEMKKMITCALAIACTLSIAAAPSQKKLFKVSVTNLTKGQPITPPVIAVHAPSFKLFTLGKKSSEGLAILAQDGITDTLVQELAGNKKVKRSVVGSGIIMPGQTQETMVEANDPRFKLSIVGMLARTNDAIVSSLGLSTKLKVGQKVTSRAMVYDAGSENNTESCSHIPAPPCGNPQVGTEGGEGFVRPHEGLLGIGDLDASRDAFSSTSALITVKRIQ